MKRAVITFPRGFSVSFPNQNPLCPIRKSDDEPPTKERPRRLAGPRAGQPCRRIDLGDCCLRRGRELRIGRRPRLRRLPGPAPSKRHPPLPGLGETGAAPGAAVVGAGAVDAAAPPAGAAGLEPDVQVVRFQGPRGLVVDVLAPQPVPVPTGDGGGIITVGLKRGVGYRLRITNIPERPGAELFPVIEVVGHLHRPEGVDPGKYPIRVVFNQDDLEDTVDRSRLVTKVIYLEDPDQAIPFRMAKDQVPVLTLNPTEPPLRVASALGRPVAIVRLGARQPTGEEIQAGAAGDLGLDWAANIGSGPCPFLSQGRRAVHAPVRAGVCLRSAPRSTVVASR